ncbi:MAG: trigger factor [Planctomycetota bacterium]|jgi:trigger factor|nr:trigger factor [Planctomycetota bacterium]
MKVELTDIGYCRKKMRLSFDSEEVDAAFEDGYRKINRSVLVKGFRRGKAPRRTLEKMFAKDVAGEARQILMSRNLVNILQDHKLTPLGPISESGATGAIRPGQPFNLDLEITLEPAFELPEYLNLTLPYRPILVEEEEVEHDLAGLRRLYSKVVPVDGEPAQAGHFLLTDARVTCEGAELKKLEDKLLQVSGDILFDLPCPDLVEKLVGVRAGETARLELVLPADHPNPELRGRKAEVEIKVKSVTYLEAPDDDQLAARVGVKNLAEVRNHIRRKIFDREFSRQFAEQEDEIIDKLVAAADFRLPPELLERETASLIENFRREQENLREKIAEQPEPPEVPESLEPLETMMEKFRPEAARLANRRVKWSILSKHIARREGIRVTREDLAGQIENLAKAYRTTPALIARRIRENNGMDAMQEELCSLKVIQFISRAARNGLLKTLTTKRETARFNSEAAGGVGRPASSEGGAAEDKDGDLPLPVSSEGGATEDKGGDHPLPASSEGGAEEDKRADLPGLPAGLPESGGAEEDKPPEPAAEGVEGRTEGEIVEIVKTEEGVSQHESL